MLHLTVGLLGLFTLHSIRISAPPSRGRILGFPTKVGPFGPAAVFSSPPAKFRLMLALDSPNLLDAVHLYAPPSDALGS